MEYHVLASGSKGNSIFIYDQGNGLLIDCGISKRQLYTKLNQLRFHESDIHHVLLTHDHIDHNKNIITPLPLSHDATSPLGFVIKGKDETILYMTDTGYVSQKNMEYIKNLDYYIFESNHDIEMLMNTRRPLFLKNRIFGDKGHLNNEYSAHVMAQVIGENTKEICLAHLSQEANTKEMALDTYQRVFDEEHIYFDNIKIADQKEIVSGGHYEN